MLLLPAGWVVVASSSARGGALWVCLATAAVLQVVFWMKVRAAVGRSALHTAPCVT